MKIKTFGPARRRTTMPRSFRIKCRDSAGARRLAVVDAPTGCLVAPGAQSRRGHLTPVARTLPLSHTKWHLGSREPALSESRPDPTPMADAGGLWPQSADHSARQAKRETS